MKNLYTFCIGSVCNSRQLSPRWGSILFTAIMVFIMMGFTQVSFGQCGDNSSGTACSNTSSGDAIIDVTTINSATINQWQTLSTTSTGQPRWRFTGVLAGTVIQFANCTGQDSELTISNPSGTVLQRDDDNELNVGLGCTPNGNDESFSYYTTVTGDHVIRMSRHGSCSNMNSGTKYLYWRVLYRPCSGVTPSYGASTWNSYVYDGLDLNYLYGSFGSTGNSSGFSYNWNTSQPITSGCGQMCDADNFSTRHMMNHNFTRGVYKFTYSSDDGIRISVDGGNTWIVNLWSNTTQSGSITVLLDGSTNVIVDQREAGGGANVNVTICQMAGDYTFGINQWNAYVHDDMDVNIYQYQGTFTESNLGFCNNWGAGQPAMTGQRCSQTMDNDYYSVRYVRQHTFTAGTYSVRCISDDGHRVGINTNTTPNWNVLNNWGTSSTDQTANITLAAGLHYIYYDMRENTGSAQASFNIVRIPDNPTGVTSNVTNNTICTSGQSVTLTAQGTEGTVYWYTASCGGTFIGTGNSITVNPTGTTTYFARNRNYSDAGCGNTLERFSSSCASITIQLGGPAPTSPNAGADVSVCNGGSVNLNGSATLGSISSSSSTTYTIGIASSDYNTGPTTATNSACPVNLSVTIPAGATITSVNVSYNMTAQSGGWMSEQRSYLQCTSVGGIKESAIYSGTGGTAGTFNYNRTGLNIANSVTGGGTINFSLHAFRTWGGSGCNTTYNQVDNSTFTITVFYTFTPIISYSWTPTTGLSNPNIANPVASPTSTTTYTMTASYNGCSASDAITVTVNPYGIDGSLSATTPTTVCQGSAIGVSASGGTGSPRYWVQTPAGSGTWNIYNNEASNAPSNGFSFTPSAPGTYRIHARWQTGCGFCWDEPGHDWTTNNKCPNFAAVDFTVLGPSTQVVLASSSVTGAVEQCTESGWTYYGTSANPNDWVFAINKNGNTFTASVDVTVSGSVFSSINTATAGFEHGSYLMPRYWNVTLTSGSINPVNPVSVRFFYNPTELAAARTARNAAWSPYSANTDTTLLRWFKSDGVAFNSTVIAGIDGNSFNNFPNITLTPTTGTINGVTYAEFSGLTSFSGGTAGYGFASSPAGGLPVKLTKFTAQAIDNSYIRLDWATALEIDNRGFEIERSEDGINFTNIGWRDGNGNTTEPKFYAFDDKTVSAGITYYYRLKQIDFDGDTEYSNIVSARINSKDEFTVSDFIPTEVKGNTKLEIFTTNNREVTIAVFNTLGQPILNRKESLTVGNNKIEFSFDDLPAGTYMTSIKSNNEFVSRKFVVIR